MSLRQQLRSATTPLHHQVDAAFGAYALHTRDGYSDFLLAHARALFGLEVALEAAGIECLLPDWPQRRRRDALQQDLHTLGLATPHALPLPHALEAATCWGLVYVLEGSRLGARLLLERVRETPWPGQLHALHYLQHAGDSALWPRFLSQLEQAAGELNAAAVCRGAELGFQQFIAAASQVCHTQAIDNRSTAAP
ncbi:MAG: biliverdin-producing heme oxygenase [Gammaproteobacteria bacterium]|nr:biliverdin-producing heme oxygenase [Gammaproteobacteria bacterium]MBU1490254.1 biliverdin-producing heme oxygenase [Gammaproteobacteria bacterium]MBU2065400.1 biliverdin-producing heme oxygenase [Gammaproteobacteria bacterium]MBU2139117.1 biliverdin-producing heme oxygenase [Gammaproteobacteria bacterium]MBU2215469.1 biliverdin-producing heme oxygenase [Gammaproteobacteria bacterium]